MRRREFIGLLGAAVAWPLAARAQQSRQTYVIGLFSSGAEFTCSELRAALIGPLQELGWAEGKNIVFESRCADDRLDRLSELAAELVRLNVDVIVARGTPAPLAAKQATASIPIVMTSAGDPVGTGLVASLARPGGNITGLSLMSPQLGGKRVELLREILPNMSRAAVLWDSANPYAAFVFKETENATRRFGIELQSLEVRGPADFDGAFETATRERPDALITVEDLLTIDHRRKIAEFATNNRLPAIYGTRGFVEAGGLMSYGTSITDLLRRAGGYVDKILKGAKPANLPIEQPTKFELIINLKTANTIGLTIPESFLLRADEVIE